LPALCSQAEASKRKELVAQVKELEGAREELTWLGRYENDDNRFKVRGTGGEGR
jgi:hypothetical protein